MGSRAASGPRQGNYRTLKAAIRLACSSMRTTGEGLNSSWKACRSVGSMRRFLSRGQSEGSIIVIIATDAPLDSRQLTRLGKRAALGLARTGSTARHGSGDFMLAFSTANIIPHYPKDRTYTLTHLADTHMNPLITATVEATEEAILNALTMASTLVGRDHHRAEAISLTRLRTILDRQAK